MRLTGCVMSSVAARYVENKPIQMQGFIETKHCRSRLVARSVRALHRLPRFRLKDDCPAFRGWHGVTYRVVPQAKNDVPSFEADRFSKRVIAQATENHEEQDIDIQVDEIYKFVGKREKQNRTLVHQGHLKPARWGGNQTTGPLARTLWRPPQRSDFPAVSQVHTSHG